nr:DUF397 domain-containing protein [Herbihabitans rhizosphaerae]
MEATGLSTLTWRKSSRSNQQAENCVEVAFVDAAVAVRDSKNPGGPRLSFPASAFASLTARGSSSA